MREPKLRVQIVLKALGLQVLPLNCILKLYCLFARIYMYLPKQMLDGLRKLAFHLHLSYNYVAL